MPQQLVAVWSPKGGVGKTFVATNVGVAMARRSDFGVALLDLDLHSADTGVYLDLLEGPGIVDVLPFLSELRPEHLEKYMLRHHRSGLMVLLGPPRPELADFVRLDQVLKIVELARRRFGCVLVDLPPHAGEEMVYECLEQSTKIILVTTQDAAALRQTRLTLEVMGKLKIDVANSVLLVLNRYHAGGSVSVERIEDFLGQPVAVRIDEDRRAVELSLFEGRPLAESGRNQRLGAALESLATQVCPAGRGQARPSGGVLSSLFRRR
jgi:pilus assembly protein CpaE